jgi:release factor glutamine methyltransferase
MITTLPDPIIEIDFENVYSPSDDTYLILDYLKKHIKKNHFDGININDHQKILDMGTGTGIIAIFLALLSDNNMMFNPKIYASDYLEEALKCAKENEERNKISRKIEYIHSNLFKSFPKSLKSSFKIIIFNPPYLPSIKNSTIRDSAWNGGEKGYEVIIKFLESVKDYLIPEDRSYVYFICSSNTNLEELNKFIEQKGFIQKIVSKKHIFFEDIFLNRLEPILI